jgi:integrase
MANADALANCVMSAFKASALDVVREGDFNYYQLARKQRSVLPKPSIPPHVLRHSCAVALLQTGIDLTAIRDYLGHSLVTTTGLYTIVSDLRLPAQNQPSETIRT